MAAAAASGREDQELARIQRVRPRTLLAIAAAAAAFYFLLPQLARVGSSWRAVQSADWAWLPLVIALSAATYLASAVALIGAVPQRIRFWPPLAQAASSFVNRVSPANVGGMALNARFLQKSGVETSSGVAAVGVDSLVGAVVHLILMVVFFTWAGRGLSQGVQAPVEQQAAADPGRGRGDRRDRAGDPPGPLVHRGQADPWVEAPPPPASHRVAQSPGKMLMLFGGSALITLAYIGALAASVQAGRWARPARSPACCTRGPRPWPPLPLHPAAWVPSRRPWSRA